MPTERAFPALYCTDARKTLFVSASQDLQYRSWMSYEGPFGVVRSQFQEFVFRQPKG